MLPRATRRNRHQQARRHRRANKLPHIWKTSVAVRAGDPDRIEAKNKAPRFFRRLNRSRHLPHADSYRHGREIAASFGFC